MPVIHRSLLSRPFGWKRLSFIGPSYPIKDAGAAAIVAAVIALSSHLSIKTVATGIETDQQFREAQAAGIDFVNKAILMRTRSRFGAFSGC